MNSWVCLLMLMLSQGSAAGQGRQAQTPADCLKSAREFLNARVKTEGRRMTSELYRSLQQEKARRAGECAAHFSLAGTTPEEALVLAELYAEAEQASQSAAAIETALSAPGLASDSLAPLLVRAITIAMKSPVSPEQLSRAEAYAARLDALPDAVVREKIDGHARINSHYRAVDIDPGIIRHSTKIIELGRHLTAEQKRALSREFVAAYGNAAEAYASLEQPAKALEILELSSRDLTAIPDSQKQLQIYKDRYRLIGHAAAPIEASTWINGQPAAGSYDPKGAVTLVQFTAHWCGPCRKSYPAVKRLQERFASRGFKVVMSTKLYGFFQGRQDLSPADETEADRGYFTGHLGTSIRVGIAGPTHANDGRYFVGGIPQVHILDRRGVHRLIMVGFDPSNEDRVAQFIERLLQETGP